MRARSFGMPVLMAWVVVGGSICELSAAETAQGRECRAAAAYKLDGGVPYSKLDAASAIVTCEKALAEMPDDLSLLAYYGRSLRKGERKVEALRALQKSADGGNLMGLCVLGNMYEDGDGVPKDEKKAVALYRQAAEQG